jgi:hypothetical protein
MRRYVQYQLTCIDHLLQSTECANVQEYTARYNVWWFDIHEHVQKYWNRPYVQKKFCSNSSSHDCYLYHGELMTKPEYFLYPANNPVVKIKFSHTQYTKNMQYSLLRVFGGRLPSSGSNIKSMYDLKSNEASLHTRAHARRRARKLSHQCAINHIRTVFIMQFVHPVNV